jgi:Flp pilus assembly protein TadG
MMGNRYLHLLHRLRRDARGVSVVEFALILPLLITIGAGGLELINYALANQKLERIASITADNVARNTLAPSERSFVDTFAGGEEIAAPFNFAANGKVIMTGVIGVSVSGAIVGKVVWQRCSGSLAGITSTVGAQPANVNLWADGPNATLPGNVTLLQNQLVVISEAAYRYEPLISLAQLPAASSNNGIVRQRSIFVSRGQAFPYVTPSTGVTTASC